MSWAHSHVIAWTDCRSPACLQQNIVESSVHVLGAFGEKDAGNHGEMWGMILGFSKANVTVWEGPILQKAVVPKLLSFFRLVHSKPLQVR